LPDFLSKQKLLITSAVVFVYCVEVRVLHEDKNIHLIRKYIATYTENLLFKRKNFSVLNNNLTLEGAVVVLTTLFADISRELKKRIFTIEKSEKTRDFY